MEADGVRFVRYQRGNTAPAYALIEQGQLVPASGDPFGAAGLRPNGEPIGEYDTPPEDVRLLAPVQPGKIIAVGLNYQDHITEDAPGFSIPEAPILFMKPPSALIGHGRAIVLPAETEQNEAEAELALVIGKRARYVRPEDAVQVVLGLACANDVSTRDYQFRDNQWTRAKGFETFCPVGAVVVEEENRRFEPRAISASLNGDAKQRASTAQLIFDLPTLITFITRVMTLEPGDLILTGTPASPPRLTPGDEITIEIDGVPVLRNPCVAETLPTGIPAGGLRKADQ